ncbi:MAG: BPSS1780 family membrane protein [Limnohabitans sp.]
MQLQIVPASAGIQWAKQGMRTFWRQPLAMSGLFFLFMATVSVVSIVPFIGSALALVVLPALTLGMMAATKTASEGKFPMPAVLYLAFKKGPQRKTIFLLGAWYALIFLVVMLLSTLADGGTFAKVYFGGAPMTPEVVTADSFQTALWISMLFYVPLSMMFWHAPALVHWYGLPAAKSLFFSFMACWRNLRAFIVYVMAWGVIFLGTGVLALLIASLMGNPQLMTAAFVPMALMVAAMFFSSMLFSVRDCFAIDLTDEQTSPNPSGSE